MFGLPVKGALRRIAGPQPYVGESTTHNPRKSAVAFSRCCSPKALPSLVVRQRALEAGQGFVSHGLPVSGEAKLTFRDKVDV